MNKKVNDYTKGCYVVKTPNYLNVQLLNIRVNLSLRKSEKINKYNKLNGDFPKESLKKSTRP